MSIILFAAFVLLLSAYLGSRLYRSGVWDWIDGIYLPIAFVGMVLFLISDDVHRQFVDVGRTLLIKRVGTNHQEAEEVGLAALRKTLGADLKVPSFSEVRDVVFLARSCRDIPAPKAGEPHAEERLAECDAALRFLPDLADFESKLHRAPRSREYQLVDNLVVGCAAAETMLSGFQGNGRVNAALAADMAQVFRDLRERGIEPGRFEADAQPLIRAYIAQHAQHWHEARISGLILMGLSPCMTLTQDALVSLQVILHRDSLYEARMARSEVKLKNWDERRLKASAHPVRAWLRYELWPYLFAVVVALKLGRVMALNRRDAVRRQASVR